MAIGTRIPDWVQLGIAEYQKRLPREWGLQWQELPVGGRKKSHKGSQAVEAAVAAEGELMLASIGAKDFVVALDIKGKSWSTEQLASTINQWQLQGQNISLLIGGPEGLSTACLQRANQRWSLSGLTLPHPLVRVVLVEQLYRAWSLFNNHPYHK